MAGEHLECKLSMVLCGIEFNPFLFGIFYDLDLANILSDTSDYGSGKKQGA
jgi:hypothetical protein